MDYLFKSEGCPGCDHIMEMLKNESNSWAGYLKIVDVKFDKESGELVTYIDNEFAGVSPIGVVPAFYSKEKDLLVSGYEKVRWEIDNASWNN